jgi:hypothetical protein
MKMYVFRPRTGGSIEITARSIRVRIRMSRRRSLHPLVDGLISSRGGDGTNYSASRSVRARAGSRSIVLFLRLSSSRCLT